MATYARKLKDASGNYVVPATRASCVYMENDSALSLLTFYPTGSIYQSFNEESPASLFGGEWEKLENTFLYGSGTKSVGDTGGEETHQLTEDEIPSHGHISHTKTVAYWEYNTSSWGDLARSPTGNGRSEDTTNHSYVESTGGDRSHNNMPPYTVINIWKRVA